MMETFIEKNGFYKQKVGHPGASEVLVVSG